MVRMYFDFHDCSLKILPFRTSLFSSCQSQINKFKKCATSVIYFGCSEVDQKVVTIAMGSVQELPKTGNVLVGYGAILNPKGADTVDWENRFQIDQWTRAREYRHSSPADIAWEMQLNKTGQNPTVGWTIFGVKRIFNLFDDNLEK